jgi:hypothetical protein
MLRPLYERPSSAERLKGDDCCSKADRFRFEIWHARRLTVHLFRRGGVKAPAKYAANRQNRKIGSGIFALTIGNKSRRQQKAVAISSSQSIIASNNCQELRDRSCILSGCARAGFGSRLMQKALLAPTTAFRLIRRTSRLKFPFHSSSRCNKVSPLRVAMCNVEC